jgi:hypothetical protein
MEMQKHRAGALGVIMLAIVGSGCSNGPDLHYKRELQLFALAYHEYHSINAKGPAKLEDLAGTESGYPNLAREIRSGEFIVHWNVKLQGSTDDIHSHALGYQRKAPESGGWVLLADGEAKPCTAAEFKNFKQYPANAP